MFLFPEVLPFDSCYDLIIWAQSKALKAFCHWNVFHHYFVKSMRDFDETFSFFF